MSNIAELKRKLDILYAERNKHKAYSPYERVIERHIDKLGRELYNAQTKEAEEHIKELLK